MEFRWELNSRTHPKRCRTSSRRERQSRQTPLRDSPSRRSSEWVAFYYSDEIRKKYTAEEVGEISVYLVNGTKALMENDKQGLSELDELDENYLKSVWDDVEDAFSKYYTEKLASDLRGEDNEDEETE